MMNMQSQLFCSYIRVNQNVGVVVDQYNIVCIYTNFVVDSESAKLCVSDSTYSMIPTHSACQNTKYSPTN